MVIVHDPLMLYNYDLPKVYDKLFDLAFCITNFWFENYLVVNIACRKFYVQICETFNNWMCYKHSGITNLYNQNN